MKAPGFPAISAAEGERKTINSELWHACAGPLVSLPPVGGLVVYFPQGHSEQVAASMQKDADSIPSYPSLPSKLICVLHNVTLHADAETDEVYAQMTLQPVNKYDNEALLASEMGLKQNKQPMEFFCKTLTASDTSTHGGFSVPRRAAEKIFPPLDFTMQPPAQELVAKDLHDVSWTFRHVYRGQPKRHLLTTGWSVFISTKGLSAGDSVLFIRDEKSQLRLGTRHANRQQSALSSSVLSSDSMHIGILAAAAHAAANNSPFTIFYNPRTSPSEFVIPMAKYNKAMYTQVSLGMRFRMMFETEESGVRRYMGTVTGISDSDPVRWKGSQWHNLQVGWDESTANERRTRVSIWEIEPVATPFYICPPPFFRPKFPKQPGMPGDESEVESAYKRVMPWLGDEFGLKDVQSSIFPAANLVQWMSMQQNPLIASAVQSYFPSIATSATQDNLGIDETSRILNFQSHQNNPKLNPQTQQLESYQQSPLMGPQRQLQPQLQKQNSSHLQQQQHQQLPKQQGSIHLQQHQQQQGSTHVQQQQQQGSTHVQQQQQDSSHAQQQQRQQSSTHAQLQHQQLLQQQGSVHLLQQQQQVSSHLLQQQQLQLQRQQQDQLLQQQQLQQHQLRPAISMESFDQQQQKQQFFGIQAFDQSQLPNQIAQSPSYQIQQGVQKPNIQIPQGSSLSNSDSLQPSALPQVLQFQQPSEQPHALLQKQQQQLHQVPLSQSQLQFSLLQKMQEQQALSQLCPNVQSQFSRQLLEQNQQFQQKQYLQQQLQLSGTDFSTAQLKQLQQISTNHISGHHKPQLLVRSRSTPTETDAPSCSTSPSTLVSPSILLNRSQQRTTGLADELFVPPVDNLLQELESKPDVGVRHESDGIKETDRLSDQHGIADQLDASSATSFSLDGNAQEGFTLPPICLDVDIQVDPRNSFLIRANSDSLIPNTHLSRGFGSGKDMQDLLSAYGNQRDVETEVSTAAISSQSFGIPYPSLPGCSNDVVANENGTSNRGLWGNQPQRMRTYTKVQKRGSVGRTIDVTRYKGYDELQHDLACIFGIEGQLDAPYRTDWKLVYVDHENDVLLVGDDPWEEFVNCVKSIKILSAAEVQQMSLDGDLANTRPQNEVCGGSDSGNVWRG